MTDKERKSCIHTIELLRRLAFNVHGVMDVIDAENCDKIIKMLEADAQRWIPCSEPPKESGTYIVTAYDGTNRRVSFVKYQKTLKRWDLTGARAYWRILAYQSLPEQWGGEDNGKA